ncbi:MAG TPA: TetR family transcriptional regulator, partial [Mycobacterium sp.]|nr:TetR family transcriptional regulator [Mycobacterium sp.]
MMANGQLTYRQRQAAATRVRVVRAARRVFARRGYGAATMAEIARSAGVAVPTVYKLYGTKR